MQGCLPPSTFSLQCLLYWFLLQLTIFRNRITHFDARAGVSHYLIERNSVFRSWELACSVWMYNFEVDTWRVGKFYFLNKMKEKQVCLWYKFLHRTLEATLFRSTGITRKFWFLSFVHTLEILMGGL